MGSAPIEFLPRRFYLVVVRERSTCSIHHTKESSFPTAERHLFPRTPGIRVISLQEQLLPGNDFVLRISQTNRFNSFLTGIVSEGSPPLVHYFFLRRRHLRDEIQAIHLICRWRLVYLQLSPREALAPFEHLPYLFSSFLSASGPFDPPNLLVSLEGIAKGLEKEVLGSLNTKSTWDADDEPNVWTISRRFIVFSRPVLGSDSCQQHSNSKREDQSAELENTIAALKRRRVSLVITLSKNQSDVNTFAAHGLETLDISSATCSSGDKDEILVSRFLEVCESTEGLIAVNGSDFSGCVSDATCIGCYLMKHSSFTAQEAIGWLRFCLPGIIPMGWELFLGQMQPQMWLEGERFRRIGEGYLPNEIDDSPTSDSTLINIGNISLGRLSLLGTRDREKHRTDFNIPASTCLSSRSQEQQHSPTAAATAAQLKRRPLTQGSIGSRRYHRSTDGSNLRADFALMHKFLHQTPTTSTRSTSNTTANSSTASLHPVPSRPKGSTRSPNGTPTNCTEALA
ncbi:hypothetical protein V7S43_000125 [Phytophthora oleae]|uniref:Uncharacterized protein n=1 Tax=Phytophthora oleae TaxID=2107226 RepID=A0ABD3GAI8_9STRA